MQRSFLPLDEPLQILAERALSVVWQILERRHQVDHAMTVPRHVVELLDVAHARSSRALDLTRDVPVMNCKSAANAVQHECRSGGHLAVRVPVYDEPRNVCSTAHT